MDQNTAVNKASTEQVLNKAYRLAYFLHQDKGTAIRIVACDIVARRSPEIWSDMLGVERFKLAEVISRETQETLDVAATRVWTAIECLRITMNFEYWRHTPGGEELVARGKQQVACMQREGEQMVLVPVPTQLREALREYATS
jgi:hypothetical protein